MRLVFLSATVLAGVPLAACTTKDTADSAASAAGANSDSAFAAASDSATLATARVRLAGPDTASQPALMALGLDLMYRQANPWERVLGMASGYKDERTAALARSKLR